MFLSSTKKNALPDTFLSFLIFHYRFHSGWAFVLYGSNRNSLRIGIWHFTLSVQQVGYHHKKDRSYSTSAANFRQILKLKISHSSSQFDLLQWTSGIFGNSEHFKRNTIKRFVIWLNATILNKKVFLITIAQKLYNSFNWTSMLI